MNKIFSRPIGYLALHPRDVVQSVDDGDGERPVLDEAGEPVVDRQYQLDFKRVVYEDPKMARRRANVWAGKPGNKAPIGLVLIVDQERLEPLGLSNLELAAFAEEQMEYWGERMKQALAADAAGEAPKPPVFEKRSRKQPSPFTEQQKADRAARRTRRQNNLAQQAIVTAGAVVVGQVIANLLTKKNGPDSPSYKPPPAPSPGSIFGLLGPCAHDFGDYGDLPVCMKCRAANPVYNTSK
ncbi:MAG TPA: hypothetical protein VFD36_20590 [Kofleriaceae bacterium]|nr:hypothetical protein [Kofleriaceae bacterium]